MLTMIFFNNMFVQKLPCFISTTNLLTENFLFKIISTNAQSKILDGWKTNCKKGGHENR